MVYFSQAIIKPPHEPEKPPIPQDPEKPFPQPPETPPLPKDPEKPLDPPTPLPPDRPLDPPFMPDGQPESEPLPGKIDPKLPDIRSQFSQVSLTFN